MRRIFYCELCEIEFEGKECPECHQKPDFELEK